MADLSEMAATPVTIELGGEDRALSPLTLLDMALNGEYLAECVRKERVQRLHQMAADFEVLGDVVTAEVRDSMVAEVLREKTEDASSVRSVGHMLWLSLSKRDGDLTQDEVMEMVTLGNVGAIREALDKISGLKPDDDDRPTEAPPSSGEAYTE